MTTPTKLALSLAAIAAAPSLAQAQQTQPYESVPNGIVVHLADGDLKLTRAADNIIHVQFAKDPAFFKHTSYMIQAPLPSQPPFLNLNGAATQPNSPTLAGGTLSGPATGSSKIVYSASVVDGHIVFNVAGTISASLDTQSGHISFKDPAGKLILAEAPNSRTLEPATVQGEQTFHVRQQWTADPDEALFGLGQHQYGLVNIKGYDIDLWQHNTEIAVPLLVSSKGYGILWDNDAPAKFGDPRDFSAIPAEKILDAAGNPGGFTRTAFSDTALTTQTTQRVEAVIAPGAAGGARRGGAGGGEQGVRWEGTLVADGAGVYQFRLNANGGYKMWIDDKLVLDHWRQNWLAWDDITKADFAANSKHKIKIEWSKDQGTTISLSYKTPLPNDPGNTSLWSMAGHGIDYYFIYGGTDKALEKVLAGYRQLTGKAPMMPSWAFGLWQSRQRYETQQASLDVVKGFRDRKIPFDNIVQDWMYWRQNDWGSHNFDPQRFPNPDQWIKDIHAMNAHLMISVWGKFYPTTDNYKALNDKGYMYPIYPRVDWVGGGFQFAFYDAFNPDARAMFWQQIDDRLFTKGVDAWWMDATEPDVVQPSPPTLDRQLANMAKTAAGTGASVANAYPLLNSESVYDGQRKAAPDQRVFILTRSGYAGQQRYGAASWSGDITSSWTAMHKQIAAGLGYSISGLPYWTMDSGGFSVPGKFNNANNAAGQDEWRELNTRWFQFTAFVPLLRVHGEAPFREMWQFGGDTSDAYKAMMKADQLRYRLFPYIYSLAGDVTQNDGTFMRPLVMDFPNDKTARDINDQYMFGPAFMVSPVTEYKARTRDVYFPVKSNNWYDFWSGNNVSPGENRGGQVNIAAPYDQIPLHIRAGSIIPMGPDLQYIAEKKADPLTLYVYTGADGQFSLYEDDGLTYQYEKGAFSRINITWNEKTQTLSLAKRTGEFPAMLKERTINIILITPTKPVPYSPETTPDKTIKYTGDAIEIKP